MIFPSTYQMICTDFKLISVLQFLFVLAYRCGTKGQKFYIPFSFLSLATNFLGAKTPTFFFCEAMLPKRSARHVSKDSFLLERGLYPKTRSRNGRQKNNACKTELQ